MPDDKDQLRTIVESIGLAQGNIFIRELLRDKKIRIGTTKSDFKKNLLAAVESGDLTLADVQKWLDDVEGWGDQHIYLYRIQKKVLDDRRWSTAQSIKTTLPASLRKLWHPSPQLQFPDTPTLTGIYYEHPTVRFEWHEGVGTWVRDPDKDYRDEIEGDTYEFRAHRFRPDRKVNRLVVQLDLGLVGLFVQHEWEAKIHEETKETVWSTVEPLIKKAECKQLSISDAIKTLDQSELNQPSPAIRAQKTRLADAGAYVEFGGATAFKESTLIRSVRRAASPSIAKFRGVVGTFLFDTVMNKATRTIRVELFGEQRRVRIHAQMKAAEVWAVVGAISDAERRP